MAPNLSYSRHIDPIARGGTDLVGERDAVELIPLTFEARFSTEPIEASLPRHVRLSEDPLHRVRRDLHTLAVVGDPVLTVKPRVIHFVMGVMFYLFDGKVPQPSKVP
jgi:hypothetical protein